MMKLTIATWLACATIAAALKSRPQMNVPLQNSTWQWQLSDGHRLDTTYEVDVYDIDTVDVPAKMIAALHSLNRFVICYISAGSWENWRPDAADFPPSVLGKPLSGWDGERWLDVRNHSALMPLMAARMDLAAEKGCDAIEPDNLDGYMTWDASILALGETKTGFNITAEDQIAYNRALADLAHARNLSIAHKNNVEQTLQVVDAFDFAIVEQCWQYHECDRLAPFVDAGKAVFQCEYSRKFKPCRDALPGFSAIRKKYNLRARPLVACPEVERGDGCVSDTLVCSPPADRDNTILTPCDDDPTRYCVIRF